MTAGPLVSVVMPVHNAAGTVGEALRSLVQQTYTDLEIVVVDDGSTDHSIAVVDALGDPRVRVVRTPHVGIVHARNKGCAVARGSYLAMLDADDATDERRIAVQVEYLERHAAVGLVGTHVRFVRDDGRVWLFEPPTDDRALRRYLLWDNPFVQSSVMCRRQAFEGSGGYTQGIVANEDYRLWIQVARAWRLAIIPEVLVTYRVGVASASRARRDVALRARLIAQWEAARVLGPWPAALPALGATFAAYALTRLGGGVERRVTRMVGRVSERRRGFRR